MEGIVFLYSLKSYERLKLISKNLRTNQYLHGVGGLSNVLHKMFLGISCVPPQYPVFFLYNLEWQVFHDMENTEK